jgi:NADH-quinone oxidoreductase subunit C
VKEITAVVPDAVLEAVEFAGQVTATIASGRILEVCRACKDRLAYTFLVDLTAVDWQDRPEGRFDVVYWMHRFTDSHRLRLKVRVADGVEVPSVTGVWKVANWMEREVFDMFGVYFADHPNLERILTWEGFNGHPLRKDFPIEGIDTGAAIYPDVYPPGGGPVAGGEGES